MSRRARLPEGRYLECTVEVPVRFHEVDVLGIVWHGHYLTYFECGREAFGERHGIGYQAIAGAGLLAPVVHVSCDYASPARYGDTLAVTARLFREDAPKLVFHYEVRRLSDSTLLATGRSTQVFTDLDGTLLLSRPEFLDVFYASWDGHMRVSHG